MNINCAGTSAFSKTRKIVATIFIPVAVSVFCACGPGPFITTPTVTDVTSTSATLGGNLEDANGEVGIRGIVYSIATENGSPEIDGEGVTTVFADEGEGVFTVSVTGLEPSTEYVFKAFARGSEHDEYTDPPVAFTTAPGVSGGETFEVDGTEIRAIAVQPDGKILVGGQFENIAGVEVGNIARLLPDGTVDPTFSADIDQPNYGGFVNAIAVQADGKILVGGYFDHINGVGSSTVNVSIARLNPDGSRDASFVATTYYGNVQCLAIEADGSILVGGILVSVNGFTKFPYIVRLFDDGSIHPSFNPGGPTVTGPNSPVHSILVQEDGKILIGGNFSSYNGVACGNLARLTSGGQLDGTFTTDAIPYSLAQQPDGMILCGGYRFPQGDGLFRIDSSGTLDPAFATTSSTGALTNNSIDTIAVQADGKILIGGYFTEVDGTARAGIARVNSDGTLDPSFQASLDGIIVGIALGHNGTIFACSHLGVYTENAEMLGAFNNDPASSTLTGVGSVDWLRGGSAPEVSSVSFEVSSNGGATWTDLGAVNRIPGGWQIAAPTLPSSGLLRARGRTTGGNYGGSTGVVEMIEDFPVPGLSKLTLANPTHADVDSDYALLGGEITNIGNSPITERGVVYSRAIDNNLPVIGGARVTKEVEGGTSSGVFEVDVFDLVGGTTYRYRAYAINSAGGVSYTDVASFTTVGAPTVISPTETSITATSAILGGNVISDGGNQITGRGVYVIADLALEEDRLGDNDTDYIEFEDLSYDPMMDPGTGVFTVAVSGLTPDTDYYYAAYAINSEGTVYSEEGYFTTDAVSEPEPSSGGEPSDLLSLVEESAPPGQVDTGFNVGGGLGGVDGIVQAIAILPGGTGQLLIAGEFNSVGGEAHRGIARIGASGAVDATFDTNTNGIVNSVAVGSDGSTLIGGIFSKINGTPRNGIAKLDENGALVIPTEFDPGAGADNVIYSVALQEDGKILIGGLFSTVQGQPRNRIARLNANGSLDTGFNPTADNAIYSIVVQPDGRILVAGNFSTIAGTTVNRVARLNANGTIDSGFDPGGGANGRVAALALQPDGKILLGGYFTQVDGANRSRIARLAANGSLDTGFNTGTGANDNILTLALQTDGKILIGGLFTNFNGTGLNRIARLNSNGDLDNTFDAGTGADDEISALALQPDGNILIGGNFATFDGGAHPFLVRFGNDAATETFTVNGLTSARWLRGGSGPLVPEVVFELSTDSGQTWSDLGDGTAIAGGWEITGLNLPINGRIRALGQTAGGFLGGSSGLAEGSASFDYTAQRNALRAKLAAAKANAAKLSAQIKAAKKKKNAAKAKKLTKSLKTVNSQIAAINADLAKYQ